MTFTDDMADQLPDVVGHKLAGRVALVTGGTRGIGAAICTSLADQGAVVAAGYSGNAERAKAFAADFERRFGAPVRLTVRSATCSSAARALAREAAFLLARSGKLTPDTIGLTVNAVAPGLIATDMLASIPATALARLTAQIPCGRLGRPEEVARIVHVLAADASSYITGQVWSVNGGMDM